MTCGLAESSVTLKILLPNQRHDIHITLGSPMLQLTLSARSGTTVPNFSGFFAEL